MEKNDSMECRSCGQRLTPGESMCPACGSPVRRHSTARVVVVAGVSVLIVALLTLLAVQRQWLEPWLPQRTSSLAREAMTRVATNPLVTDALGQPVRAGSSVLGNVSHDETGWTEAFLSIPVSGPKAEGTLYVRAGRGSGSWTFSNLELRVNGGLPMNLLDERESVHQEPATEPQFLPDRGANRPDGRYPCFLARAAAASLSIDARTTECLPGLRTDRRYDEVEVNLRGGFLVLRKTDFLVQDDLPLVFTRCFRMWDTESRAFGIGWNHPYDILPVGTRNP